MTTRRRRQPRGALRRADRIRYERIIDAYLRRCYADRTVARASELAQLLSGNRQHVSEVVLELLGKPLRDILREKRLAEAVRLLKLTPLRLDDLARASAFGHRSTFFRAFAEAFGITPTEFRNRYREDMTASSD